jgi:flagellin-specific chaperone FliS
VDNRAMPTPPDPSELPVPCEPVEIPEHIVVILLEAAERHCAKVAEAFAYADLRPREHFVHKIETILEDLDGRLNHEEGGSLVNELARTYAWWRSEISEASRLGDAERLGRVRTQMGDIRRAWEHVLFEGEGMSGNPEF